MGIWRQFAIEETSAIEWKEIKILFSKNFSENKKKLVNFNLTNFMGNFEKSVIRRGKSDLTSKNDVKLNEVK